MKTVGEKGLGRLELGFACTVAPNTPELRGTVGALALAVALPLGDSLGFA